MEVVSAENPKKETSLVVRLEKSFTELNAKRLSHTNTNTKLVRTARPVSAATFLRPILAITAVRPAKNMESNANT